MFSKGANQQKWKLSTSVQLLLARYSYDGARRQESACSKVRSTNHAFNSSVVHLDRGRGNPLAYQPIHPDGEFDQIDPERSGRHLRSRVAPQRIWIASLPLRASRRIANAVDGTQQFGRSIPRPKFQKDGCGLYLFTLNPKGGARRKKVRPQDLHPT